MLGVHWCWLFATFDPRPFYSFFYTFKIRLYTIQLSAPVLLWKKNKTKKEVFYLFSFWVISKLTKITVFFIHFSGKVLCLSFEHLF